MARQLLLFASGTVEKRRAMRATKSRTTSFSAAAGAAFVVCAMIGAPTAGANTASASTTINDLKSEGYIVHINWLSGYNTQQLDDCWVNDVNIPGDTPESRTTAYVDVSCPNNVY
jgi:hypothetical protein